MKKLTILIASMVLPLAAASATQYVKSDGGNISKISDADFVNCTNKIFRKSGQEGLSTDLKKQLAIESLKGNTVNDLDALKSRLKGESACTYGADDEKF
jgi:hypothetical protein